MKVTAILKDLAEPFFTGVCGGKKFTKGFDNLSDEEKLRYVLRPNDLKITAKIGTGQFRDRVELNEIMRNGGFKVTYTLEPRRGYKLTTFIVEPDGPA